MRQEEAPATHWRYALGTGWHTPGNGGRGTYPDVEEESSEPVGPSQCEARLEEEHRLRFGERAARQAWRAAPPLARMLSLRRRPLAKRIVITVQRLDGGGAVQGAGTLV